MRKVSIIGIGAGNPAYLTLQAVAAIGAADVFFIPDKGEDKAALNAVRNEMLAAHASRFHRLAPFAVPERTTTPTYTEGVKAWRAALRDTYRRLIETELGEGETGAFLVWGDPALYDGTIGIIDDLRIAGLAIEVETIPGISAVQALCAAHRIPLNRVGETITIMSARRVLAGEADELSSFVVMLDSEAAWKRFADEDAEIFWGAYLGMGAEILVSGRIGKVADEIERVRREARARTGWVMDTYLVRRRMLLISPRR
jgi:precorrin-6A synthase